MVRQRAAHEGLPLRIEAYPSPGPSCVRHARDARALRVTNVALEIVAASAEPVGAVLRIRANEPIGSHGQCDLVTRVIDCQSRRDGQHRIYLAILGKDRLERLEVKEAVRDARYPVSVAT